VKARQQVTAVKPQRIRRVTGHYGRFEFCRVAPEVLRRDAHFPVTPARHHLLAERKSQMSKRLVEHPPGVLVVLLGPQQREERVPALEAARPGNGEVGEESDALGLREDRVKVLAVGVPLGERSERAELDHVRKGT
jgi:hypothetical protein